MKSKKKAIGKIAGYIPKNNFWDVWVKANHLEKINCVKDLLNLTDDELFKPMSATLMNSYLEDLYYHIKKAKQ